MQIGIFAATFVKPTLQERLDAVRAHGFTHIQFSMGCVGLPELPDAIDDTLCYLIRDEVAQRDMTIAVMSGTFNMCHPDPQHRHAGVQRLGVLISACRRIGVPIISLCTGTRDPNSMWRHHPENGSADAWRDMVETVRAAVRIAEDAHITLAFEPEVSNVVDSAQKARRLLDEIGSESLKVVIDGANIFHKGELPFELLGTDIVSAHAKDLDSDGEAGHLPAGHGLLDYAHYLRLLRHVGFEGTLLLHGLTEAQVDGCAAFLKSKLAEVTAENDDTSHTEEK